MTREEAIRALCSISVPSGNLALITADVIEALSMAIDALHQPSLPESLEGNAMMLENILGTYKTLEDMLDFSKGQDQDLLESMNFEREWLKKRLSQKMPEDLDEAAEEYVINVFGANYGLRHTAELLRVAFKTGAKWTTGQGVTFQSRFHRARLRGYISFPILLEDGKNFNNGEEVIVQIRKKED